MMIDVQKEFSRDFQKNLLDLLEMCYENETDSCTLTFEYPSALLEIDFTFSVKKRVEE